MSCCRVYECLQCEIDATAAPCKGPLYQLVNDTHQLSKRHNVHLTRYFEQSGSIHVLPFLAHTHSRPDCTISARLDSFLCHLRKPKVLHQDTTRKCIFHQARSEQTHRSIVHEWITIRKFNYLLANKLQLCPFHRRHRFTYQPISPQIEISERQTMRRRKR
jgi:hypothetical protein